jgi:HSP20 family molecular chaperone IbpA
MATMTTPTTTSTPAPARRATAQREGRTLSPPVDIYETEAAFMLLADMPGVTAEGLEVLAERDTLVIRGRVERPSRPPDLLEFDMADYRRTFTLSEDLDVDGIKAHLRDGVLRVEIPKTPGVRPKKIPVNTD